MAERPASQPCDDASLVLEERFAVVPEWLLDTEISDCAVRLYAVLLRYGQVSGARMPSRATLARRLRKKSTDTVDRALRELVELGAVTVEPRWSGRERLTNAYRVRTSLPRPPDGRIPAMREPAGPDWVGRTDAATPVAAADPMPEPGAGVRAGGGRIDAAGCTVSPRGGRTDRVRVTARMRHNPEFLTESSSPPPPAPPRPARPATSLPSVRSPVSGIAAVCGIADWARFVAACQDARRRAGQPTGRWSGPCLDAALQLAVRVRQWPANQAPAALLALAGDPETRSPMRLAEAGPWWDGTPVADPSALMPSKEEVEAAELELDDAGGLRVLLQRQAREQLAAESLPVQRATVALRALQLLRAHQGTAAAYPAEVTA